MPNVKWLAPSIGFSRRALFAWKNAQSVSPNLSGSIPRFPLATERFRLCLAPDSRRFGVISIVFSSSSSAFPYSCATS